MIRGSSELNEERGVTGSEEVGDGVSFHVTICVDRRLFFSFFGFVSRLLATSWACRLICVYDSPPALLFESDLEPAVLLTKRKLCGAGISHEISVWSER